MSDTLTRRFVIPIHSHSVVEFLDLVGKNLKEQGNSLSYIPQDKYIAKTARRQLDSDTICVDYLRHQPSSNLNRLCKKYKIDSPRQIIFSQMVYDRCYDSPSYRSYWSPGIDLPSEERYHELFHRTLDHLDQLYESGDGGVPLQFQGGEVLRQVLQRVADYHGYSSVRASFSPVPGHLFLRSKEKMRFPPLEAAKYEEMMPEQREAAQKLRRSVTERQGEVIVGPGQSESLFQGLRRKVRLIQEHQDNLAPIISDWVRRRVAKPLLGAATRQLYQNKKESLNFIKSNKYVFYPLQYFRESRVTMRAPEFYNQLWMVEYLSRSLPPEYELVVKDHPQQLGALPLSHAYKLRRYATVVAPTLSAREVLTEADAVVTINNTVGYEAVMYGKPVVTLGDAFYSGVGYTRDVTDLNSLPTELNEAVHSDGLCDETVVEFAHGLLQSSYGGEWGGTHTNNVENYVESITEFLKNQQQ